MLLINKTFLLTVLVVFVIVVLLANIELWYNNRKCTLKIPVNKDFHILTPEQTGLSHNVVVYKNSYKDKDALKMEYADGLNIKKHVEEHVGSKMVTPIRDIGKRMKEIPYSSTPLNDIVNCVSKTSTFIGDTDIRNFDGDTGYKMLLHEDDDRVKAYIAYGMLYMVIEK
jgi:hypothetical protein